MYQLNNYLNCTLNKKLEHLFLLWLSKKCAALKKKCRYFCLLFRLLVDTTFSNLRSVRWWECAHLCVHARVWVCVCVLASGHKMPILSRSRNTLYLSMSLYMQMSCCPLPYFQNTEVPLQLVTAKKNIFLQDMASSLLLNMLNVPSLYYLLLLLFPSLCPHTVFWCS